MDALIVGGSLGGLTLALVLGRHGIAAQIVERASDAPRQGGTLGIDRSLLLKAVLGKDAAAGAVGFPVLSGRRQAVAWETMYDWLRERAENCETISWKYGVAIREVFDGAEHATAVSAAGEKFRAALIVGADGYRSVVRRVIEPARAGAKYAGYVLWRSLVAEEELPGDADFAALGRDTSLVTRTGHRLVAYPVAGAGGALEPGRRRISFTWYDPSRLELLRTLKCVDSAGVLTGSISAERMPGGIQDELLALAGKFWPAPMRAVIELALRERRVFATPVAEYYPLCIQAGRLAVIGDAAHTVAPVTAKGFVAAIEDAESLTRHLARARQMGQPNVPAVLEAYAKDRLAAGQAMVRSSMEWSQEYARDPIKATLQIAQRTEPIP